MENWKKVYYILAEEWNDASKMPFCEAGDLSGETYEEAHRKLTEARNHICERFDLNAEDRDLEQIMNAVLQIEQDMARRSFLYGYRMGCGKEDII